MKVKPASAKLRQASARLEFPREAEGAGSILLSAAGSFVAFKSGAYLVVVWVVFSLLLVRYLGIPNEATYRQHRGAVRFDLPVDGLEAGLVFGGVLAVYYAVLHFGAAAIIKKPDIHCFLPCIMPSPRVL
jgi:hypothetical protein